MALQKQNMVSKNGSVAVHRKEAFDIGYKQYFKNLASNRISQILNNKERVVKLENITYRQLNSWGDEGLLTNDREDRSWRKFSIMDALWVKVIQELREFGLSREQIKNTKYSLGCDAKEYGVPMPILEFYTAFAIGSKMPVLLLVFKDGVCVPANFTQYKVAREFGEVENHLQINLNKILQDFFPTVDLKPQSKAEMPLTLEEVELLAFIRLKTFEKVEVKYKNGSIDLLEGLESVSNKKRIQEILKEQKYASIELIEEDGKVTRILRKIKKKI
jgi:DNA-binding transcriptional MerR regulator